MPLTRMLVTLHELSRVVDAVRLVMHVVVLRVSVNMGNGAGSLGGVHAGADELIVRD